MRALLVVVAAALLGGCNMVVSETSLFSTADAAGAPPLRPGVWAQRKADCEFDRSKPVRDWPECAGGAVLTPEYFGEPDGGAKKAPYVLAAGDPRVLQLEFREEENAKLMYFFAGLQPLKLDDRGRIVEARTWLVQCGPPPPQAESEGEEAAVPETETAEEMEARLAREVEQAMSQGLTRDLLPGLEAQGGLCVAREPGPVRNAAAKSLAWDEDPPSVIYWVRDGGE